MSDTDPLAQLEAGPIFVTGWVRSGTTWLYDVLTGHPEVGGVLESWMFTNAHGVGGALSELHWEPDGAGSAQGLSRITTEEDVLAGVRRLTGEWLARGLGPGDRYLVEKSPSHLFKMQQIARVHPAARFVHIVRDGRDVVVSVRAAAESWAPGWRESFGISLRDSARAWERAVLTGLEHDRELGDRCLTVRYEDVRRSPRESYERIFDHCRIPLAEGRLDEIAERGRFRRGAEGEGAHRRSGTPGEWRRALRPWEAFGVTRAARRGLEAAGYPLRGRRETPS